MVNILWAGTEADAFDTASPQAVTTSSSEYDVDFSRSATEIRGGGDRCNKQALSDIPEAWWHYRWGGGNTGGVANNRGIVTFFNSANVGVLRLLSLSTPAFRLEYWNGSAWTAIGADFTTTLGVNGRTWDIKCLVDNTVGDFAIWIDGTLTRQLTGDTDFFSGSAVDYVTINGWGATNARFVSECIIADGDTRGMRLATLVPNGAGATTDFTGTFADVDEVTINDADFLSSATANQVETMTLTNLSAVAGALTPVAVVATARARNAATGPQNLQLAVRTNSLDFFSSSLPSLGTSFLDGYFNVWNTNPDTTTAWTVSEINALEAGVKSIT